MDETVSEKMPEQRLAWLEKQMVCLGNAIEHLEQVMSKWYEEGMASIIPGKWSDN